MKTAVRDKPFVGSFFLCTIGNMANCMAGHVTKKNPENYGCDLSQWCVCEKSNKIGVL